MNIFLKEKLDNNRMSGVNFINWFNFHREQEKIAMEICNQMKISIIPVFVQVAKTYKELSEKKNHTPTENELIFDYTKLVDCNRMLGHLLDDFQRKYSNAIDSNLLIDLRISNTNGLLSRPDFKNKKWMKIFNICELSACKILYSMIAYLDQNMFISSNVSLREHNETVDYFFYQNLKTFLAGK